jgi:ABC-type multidrug transport system permease subunit
LECRGLGCPLGRLRAAEGGKSGVSPFDKVVYAISKALVHYIPILLGLFIFVSACIGYGKPPAKSHVRFLVGMVGFLLLFLGVRLLIVSK